MKLYRFFFSRSSVYELKLFGRSKSNLTYSRSFSLLSNRFHRTSADTLGEKISYSRSTSNPFLFLLTCFSFHRGTRCYFQHFSLLHFISRCGHVAACSALPISRNFPFYTFSYYMGGEERTFEFSRNCWSSKIASALWKGKENRNRAEFIIRSYKYLINSFNLLIYLLITRLALRCRMAVLAAQSLPIFETRDRMRAFLRPRGWKLNGWWI